MQIQPIDERPSVRTDFEQRLASFYKYGVDEDDYIYEQVCQATKTVMDTRGLDIAHDIVVHVPRWRKAFGAPKTAAIATAAKLSHDSHVLIFNGWAWRRLDGDKRRDIIAHELCHAHVSETEGEEQNEEDSHVFQRTLREYDAPVNFKQLLDEPKDVFYRDHP